MILAGDVGGTKVDLALCKFENGQLLTVHDHKFHAREFPGLVQVVEAFLQECRQTLGQPVDVLAACFGVPGPVRQGRLKLTNLPWVLDSSQLKGDLKIEHVFLINDLEANGYGIAELTPDQILVLSKGDPAAEGNRGLIAALSAKNPGRARELRACHLRHWTGQRIHLLSRCERLGGAVLAEGSYAHR